MGERSAAHKEIRDRIVKIKLVDGTLVNGQVNINRESGYDRLSDLISSTDDAFLVLFDVTLYDPRSPSPLKMDSLFVNKSYIVWAEPDENQK